MSKSQPKTSSMGDDKKDDGEKQDSDPKKKV